MHEADWQICIAALYMFTKFDFVVHIFYSMIKFSYLCFLSNAHQDLVLMTCVHLQLIGLSVWPFLFGNKTISPIVAHNGS